MRRRHGIGGRFWHPFGDPFGVRFVFDGVPGASLSLNPRLMSCRPPGWFGAPACRSNDTPLSARTAPKDLVTSVSWKGAVHLSRECVLRCCYEESFDRLVRRGSLYRGIVQWGHEPLAVPPDGKRR